MTDAIELVELLQEFGDDNIILENRRVPRVILPRLDPFNFYDDKKFKKRYRLTKQSVKKVIRMVREKLEPEIIQKCTISIELKVLVTLRYYAKGCLQLENGKIYILIYLIYNLINNLK
jgi:hypothetical protein